MLAKVKKQFKTLSDELKDFSLTSFISEQLPAPNADDSWFHYKHVILTIKDIHDSFVFSIDASENSNQITFERFLTLSRFEGIAIVPGIPYRLNDRIQNKDLLYDFTLWAKDNEINFILRTQEVTNCQPCKTRELKLINGRVTKTVWY